MHTAPSLSYTCLFPLLMITLCTLGTGQSLIYRNAYEDPVLKEMRLAGDSVRSAREEETAQIRELQKTNREKERAARQVIALDWKEIRKPAGPQDFDQVFHFPPHRQYRTGTCWSFSTTSFLESEISRLYGKRIRLSEMHTVYYEYLYKAQRFVQERGDSNFGEGSEANAVTRVWKQYGAVPYDSYPGVLAEDGRFDHHGMFREMSHYLDWVKQQNLWDEKLVLNSLRVIMNRYMGEPPASFVYEGKHYTPREFLEEILWLDPDDYVCLMSTLKLPFHSYGEYAVPDNWWHSREYYNVPLAEFYEVIVSALRSGYSLFLGGDVSEPGIDGFENAAVIPEWDLPPDKISPAAREFRVENGTTTDDHGIHAVGHKKLGKQDWFLIKDSGSAAYRGQHDGYFFYREDFVKLKMRTLMVHKDIVQKVVREFKPL